MFIFICLFFKFGKVKYTLTFNNRKFAHKNIYVNLSLLKTGHGLHITYSFIDFSSIWCVSILNECFAMLTKQKQRIIILSKKKKKLTKTNIYLKKKTQKIRKNGHFGKVKETVNDFDDLKKKNGKLEIIRTHINY